MTTLDILVGVVVILGMINLAVLITVLGKLSDIKKRLTKNSAILVENRSNMNKVVKLLSILMERTKNSRPINLN